MQEKVNKPKIIFMGTPEFAAIILCDLLKASHQIISIYTQKDKKVGRQQKIEKSAVKKIAEENNLKIFQPEKFDAEVISEIKEQNPDIIIVAAYGKILPKDLLVIPKFGVINTHPSLLPKYRGASPIQNALLNGEKETAATIMLMEEKVDAGKILSQKKVEIKNNETYLELSKKLAKISAELLSDTLFLWIAGKIKPIQQDDKLATFCQLIRKEDGKIDWSDEAQSIYNHYRAFVVWPGIFTHWEKENKKFRLKLNKISLDCNESQKNLQNGEVFSENDQIKIKTGKGAIVLEEIQIEGKNKTSTNDFIRGYPNFIGSVLK